MVDLLTTIVRSIFPPRDTELKLDSADNILLAVGNKHDCFFLTAYDEPTVQSAIIENKFHGNNIASKILGNILAQSDYVNMSQTVFIPIPLGRKRYQNRGYNQVLKILKYCPTKININNKALSRTKETLAQANLNKVDRIKNTRDAFSFKPDKLSSEYETIVLLDDVLTTGSTLESARQTIKGHLGDKVKIICLAIAH